MLNKLRDRKGVWIDAREAFILSYEMGSDIKELHLVSDIEDYHPSGGARSSVPYGPMDKVSDKSFLNRKKEQEKVFIINVISNIVSAKEILIFGPAGMKTKLNKTIKDNQLGLKAAIYVSSADSMTSNQRKAFFRTYFDSILSN